MSRWWEQWPGRLEFELEELRNAGIRFEQDPEALRSGFVRLRINWPIGGETVPLVVTYPEHYPYFRPEIQAPSLSYGYHQNPHLKNLCLLGRSTYEWNQDFTIWWLLEVQLPKVLATVNNNEDAINTGEERQAEPFGGYYPYDRQSIILIDSKMVIEPSEGSGWLSIGTMPEPAFPRRAVLQGAVLEILGNNNVVLARADPRIREAYSGRKLKARWCRSPTPIAEFDPSRFFAQVERLDPGVHNYSAQPFGAGSLRMYGVVFPEEHRWRAGGAADGWVFVGRYEQRKASAPLFAQARHSVGGFARRNQDTRGKPRS